MEPAKPTTTILVGNVTDQLATLPERSVHCVVTSPPYWGLRDYGRCDCATQRHASQNALEMCRTIKPGASGQSSATDKRCQKDPDPACPACNGTGIITGTDVQIGLEPVFDCGAWAAKRYAPGIDWPACPGCFLCTMVRVFAEVHRALRDDGTCWVNMGDSYSAGGRKSYDTTSKNKGNGKPPDIRGDGLKRYRRNASKNGADVGGWACDSEHDGGGRVVAPGLKPKDRVMQPAILALALQAHGWYLRDEIVWRKPNPMPESVRDRTTKAHEMLYLLTKGPRYFYDADAIREMSEGTDARLKRDPGQVANGAMRNSDAEKSGTTRGKTNQPCCPSGGRNARSVWTIKPHPFPEAHFATFPVELPLRCIKAGTSAKGCCPSCGAPWKRLTEKVSTGKTHKMADGWDTGAGGHGTVHREGRQKGEAGKPVTTTATIGWEPTCECVDQEATGQSTGPDIAPKPVPCTVLDPFSGSGTTGIAAWQLGQHYIGCELNPEYAAMSERRIAKATRPGTYVDESAAPTPLFGGAE